MSGIVPKNWDVECEVLVVGGGYLGLVQFRGTLSAMLPENSLAQKVAILEPFMQQCGRIPEL